MSILGSMMQTGEVKAGEPGILTTFADFLCDGWPKQDVTQVQHLLRHVLAEVKRRHPGVRRITIQSDNASCFASGAHVAFILALNAQARQEGREGVLIDAWINTEAQAGKSKLDTHFSFVQHRLMRYVLEDRHSLSDYVDMFQALESKGGIAGTSTTLVNFAEVEAPKSRATTIAGISEVHHISYAGLVPLLRRFSGVDERMIPYKAGLGAVPDLAPLQPPTPSDYHVSQHEPMWSPLQSEPPAPGTGAVRAQQAGPTSRAMAFQDALRVLPAVVYRPPPTQAGRDFPPDMLPIAPPAMQDGWAGKKQPHQALDAKVQEALRAMQNEAKGPNRVTPEAAYRRVKLDLDLRKDWRQLLLLSVQSVKAVMTAEWRRSEKAAPAAAPAAAVEAREPARKRTRRATATPAPPPVAQEPPSGDEMDSGDESEADSSLRDAFVAQRDMGVNA